VDAKTIVLIIFIGLYALVLTRKIRLSILGGAAVLLLLLLQLVGYREAICELIDWDVLGIYWGFMMVSQVFMESRVPELLANRILQIAKTEKYALVMICALTAFLSAFMQNVGVVLMMAPVAIATARRLESSLFPYLVSVAISSNVVTTVTMVADPPAIILALRTGMNFFDFYWFQGRIGLGIISLAGTFAALGSLLYIFRHMTKRLEIARESLTVNWRPALLFFGGVLALALAPEIRIRPGWVGLAVGMIALWMGRGHLKKMIVEFDWDSFLFVTSIFVLIGAVSKYGILSDATKAIAASGVRAPGFLLAFVTWISVLFSAIIDNVPYTLLMIPVCRELSELSGISAWPLLYGMIVGTGIGGNITPVGATANVFACGILEKNGCKIRLGEYLKISLPFTLAAVGAAHLLLHFIWLR